MKAIVKFHYGKKIYEIGDDVPEEIVQKYPHLVGLMFTKEKSEIVEAKEKMETYSSGFSATQKVRRK